MALTYKNARQAVGTSYTTVYTCPSATTAIVLNALAANVDGTNAYDASLQWLDSSASNVATRLIEPVTIPAKAAQKLLDGPVILEAGDAIQAKASSASKIELTLAIDEIT